MRNKNTIKEMICGYGNGRCGCSGKINEDYPQLTIDELTDYICKYYECGCGCCEEGTSAIRFLGKSKIKTIINEIMNETKGLKDILK